MSLALNNWALAPRYVIKHKQMTVCISNLDQMLNLASYILILDTPGNDLKIIMGKLKIS